MGYLPKAGKNSCGTLSIPCLSRQQSLSGALAKVNDLAVDDLI